VRRVRKCALKVAAAGVGTCDMQSSPFKTPADAITFMLAGNATITVRSEKTQMRYTFKIKRSKDGAVHFVSLMNGPDNENSFQYMGILKNRQYLHGRKSRITADAVCVKAFSWTFATLARGIMPDALKVWHEGSCGRCGRKLTVPESIERGLGPECVQYVTCEAV
jgi:hypothetical protein